MPSDLVDAAWKVYVQHKLKEKSAEAAHTCSARLGWGRCYWQVKQMIADGGYIYVCGATSMGKQAQCLARPEVRQRSVFWWHHAFQVRDELELALGSADYLERLKTEQRYVEELW